MTEQLTSWNDGAAKNAVIDFVTRVTTPASLAFVPPAGRITVFDNDGTLWSEKLMYIQLDMILRVGWKCRMRNLSCASSSHKLLGSDCIN